MQTFHNIGTTTDWIVMVVYFIAIMLFGSYFGRYTKNTSDFFFGGRRFSWWLITMSIVATGVGSHSFVKYSAKGFEHGISSTMTYLNDWFFIPFFMFGWLPIIVYSKIRSIPEYFEKRFSPSARFLATILLLLYMIGYIGIGFLTLGKAVIPMLPEAFTVLGMTLPITLMGAIIVIAVITGIYITFGGQTAVIFTDLLQGFILLFAGLLLFFFGITYLGGFDMFWNLLPTEWKLPMADFNQPANFNFVGIFWQDAIAGSIGFLFMNQGLIMRFMACKNVNEGRKAAAVNILFVLPISAIVVGNAGWIGKAISVVSPDIVSPSVSPDQIFVVVANIIASPGMFGFIMAALTAALMSTVDTLINATAAIFINDVYRPVQQFVKRNVMTDSDRDKKELRAARYASIGVTALGVLAVLAFKNFPTVYEAHGYFHSTLTPPLVVGIFLGVFWKRFTPAAVITTFVGGVALMILGARYPGLLIAPFDHGIEMNPDHPYSYIRALYNTLVCMGAAVLVTITTQWQRNICSMIRENQNQKLIMRILVTIILLVYSVVLFNILGLTVQIASAIGVLILVPITVTYYVKYDEKVNTNGLTAGSINIARNLFKGGEPNDQEGETVFVQLKQVDGEDSVVQFSTKDMAIMKAEIGDLVYISDKRKWMGGLKSIHAVFGQPHDEEGMVYITPDQIKHGMFVDGKMLEAEKEM
ncbi:MAG: sodium:solute symporter family protein [Candidatus Marinimicrobia bacterium]|jgi:SSS family solute:Na+ symporter|nr:sodium:solute symporter family protein [Candidatus Neomarinimicrobiota bacterium]MBT5386738.1 sodium:solute symporter family protein [Candidatus Neomarinimicrobiota bacterium]MBT5775967.1 sodium:solute symporter family protein [Candidatus Neomarinimicrobiota bacterium]MBT6390084.1 sodium:solute symporter family protein [Candidatus Neomarinimicrobiota bacterium]MBT6942408.1 sodium:solute symporter family protein [Candidatus Neomarinimicrobiota bacterium]